MNFKTLLIAGLVTGLFSGYAQADSSTGPAMDRGDRINERLDRRSDRAAANGRDRLANRLDRRGDRIDNRLDHKGQRIDRRLDRVGNRVDRRLDRRQGGRR
jgi:hypothetical protein